MSRRDELTPEVVAMIDAALVDRYEANRLLNVKQVARLFTISERQVHRLIADGVLEHTRIGTRIGVRQAAAIAYLQANTHGGQATAAS